jgi:ribose-phosphate pyrophosphokinase
LEEPVVVAPDVGAVQRADRVRQALGGCPLAILFKERPRPDEVAVQGMVGDVAGKYAIIVDDLISTGKTLIAAAETCLSQGATGVTALATHGVFAEGAIARLHASAIEMTLVSDTIPIPADAPGIEVVSVAPMLSEVINRVHYGISVSDLVRDLMPT